MAGFSALVCIIQSVWGKNGLSVIPQFNRKIDHTHYNNYISSLPTTATAFAMCVLPLLGMLHPSPVDNRGVTWCCKHQI